jgi:hypothetical protein
MLGTVPNGVKHHVYVVRDNFVGHKERYICSTHTDD